MCIVVRLHEVKIAIGILEDAAKRTYVDTKLETDRKRKEKYAASDKRKQEMIDVSPSPSQPSDSEVARSRSPYQVTGRYGVGKRARSLSISERSRCGLVLSPCHRSKGVGDNLENESLLCGTMLTL